MQIFATSQEQTAMTERAQALRWLEQETRALAVRLDRVKSFALQETMVPAAAPSAGAQAAIERYLVAGRRELRRLIADYLRWLTGPEGQSAPPSEAQRRFAFLRMRFNAVLSQFDIFADAMTQRSEHETGVWLGGLDVLAADALNLPGRWFDPTPSSVTWIAATARRYAGRKRPCPAAAKTRWRSSACPASGWSATASLRPWSTKWATRARPCST